MTSGVASCPVARDSRSQPMASRARPMAPTRTWRQEVQRSARYSVNGVLVGRIASHSTRRTAGSPAITESEIVSPLATTAHSVVTRSTGLPRSSTKMPTTAT